MPFWNRTPVDLDPDVQTVEDALRPLWDTYFSAPDRLTPAQSAVMHAWVTHGMVGNGGLPHFIETTGDRGSAVVEAFHRLGLDDYADVIQRTLRLYPTAAADDPDERLSAHDAWADGGAEDSELDVLDERAEQIGASGRLQQAAAAFVRAHPSDFPAATG
jgi:hypothetical protein